MAITAAQVNELRKRTGISMMQCKKALEESGGDEEKAIEILRKKGAAKAAEKSDRETSEGLIVTRQEGNKAVMVTLYCETDFVSKNEEFVAIANKAADTAMSKGSEAATSEAEPVIKELFTKLGENMSIEVDVAEGEGVGSYVHTNGKLGALVTLSGLDAEKAKNVAMHITAMNPLVVDPSEVSEELVTKEKEIWADQLKNEGKPAEMIDKIMMGKESKFRAESALVKQDFVMSPDMKIDQYLGDIKVMSFVRKSI